MSPDALITLAVLVASVALWITEKLAIEVVALLAMLALIVTGVLSVTEGLGGFANPATATFTAMFILSAGLFRTGALTAVGTLLRRVGRRSTWLLAFALMVAVGAVSAFINNTAAVALLLPMVLGVAHDLKVSPSKLLMPLSYASMFGGMCTLIGTSTNILASSIGEAHGLRPLGMFEFTPLGIMFFGAGLIYMLAIGIRLLPARRPASDLATAFDMRAYLTEIVLQPDSPSVGKAVARSPLVERLDIDVLEVVRNGTRIRPVPPDTILQVGDLLRVRCHVKRIRELQARRGIRLKADRPLRDTDIAAENIELVEAVIAPNSELVGTTLKAAGFRDRFGAVALALRHRGETLHERLGTTVLRAGDALLIEATPEAAARLSRHEAFVVVSDVDQPRISRRRLLLAGSIIALVIGVAALELVPIAVAAIAGAMAMVLAGALSPQQAAGAVEWRVILLLAGALALGTAMEKTGLAHVAAEWMVAGLGRFGPVALVAAFYLLTALLTETMSNNATVALLAPIAIVSAEAVGLDPRPLLFAVTFAASASFMTPVGYQTNTLIYGPGGYRFGDYMRVGAPLNLVFWVIASLMIPRLWPM
jgi:di/tricarboxylate transporter